MLDKTYAPQDCEDAIFQEWDQSGAFACGQGGTPFTVMMPPANVTGSLHLGHALTFTIQDTLIRYQRMKGRDALWQPGVDHAGIATQFVVERQLADKGQTRQDLGREKFVKTVWDWKAQSGDAIVHQLKKLGSSAHWERERFTMDPAYSKAVLKAFVDLYHKGLIYRDKRLVNWDPKLKTAISNLEVENKEGDGNLWYIRYPLADMPEQFITVATTRPETMLGDTGVAVHPEDERYQSFIGKKVRLPLTNRLVPIVGDTYSDPGKGSGAVKITPAHDFNDFEVGRRHNLELLSIFDGSAVTNENVPEAYRNLDRYVARKKVLEDLEALGLVEKIEPIKNTVPLGDRSGVMVEPHLTDQWYVDAKTLAQPALKAVEEGHIRFVPKQWENTYFDWLRNIEPWCISRQIWWGHQIPAWYGPEGHVFVAESEEKALIQAQKHYGREVTLTQDQDVLDTWFSSALWPFATLGWPEKTPDLSRYYPTDVLVTGFDIIFFWVSRMIMFGLHFMGEVPFKDVYIHALVRDEKGHKMSKTKGNVLDPLNLIAKFGTDALRFTINMHAAQGRDVRLSEKLIETHRNFITKLWNAARFLEMNGCKIQLTLPPVEHTLNLWIVSEMNQLILRVEDALDAYKLNEAAQELYQFIWGTYCDWYVELSKPLLMGGDTPEAQETRITLGWVLGQVLHLLHPFAPFVTEKLWKDLNADPNPGLLITAPWPKAGKSTTAMVEAQGEISWVLEAITAIRGVRGEINVPAGAQIPAAFHGLDAPHQVWLERHTPFLLRMARLKAVRVSQEAVPSGSVSVVIGSGTIALPLAEIIDMDAERDRLKKEIAKNQEVIDMTTKKLSNGNFVDRAPKEIVEEHQERIHTAKAALEKLSAALQRMGG